MIRVNIVTTIYPPPHFDGHDGDYLPDGDADVETRDMTFSELVRLLTNESILNPSSYLDAENVSHNEWLSCETYQDYRSGEWTEKSVHFARDNAPSKRKYWRWAWRAAGIIK